MHHSPAHTRFADRELTFTKLPAADYKHDMTLDDVRVLFRSAGETSDRKSDEEILEVRKEQAGHSSWRHRSARDAKAKHSEKQAGASAEALNFSVTNPMVVNSNPEKTEAHDLVASGIGKAHEEFLNSPVSRSGWRQVQGSASAGSPSSTVL